MNSIEQANAAFRCQSDGYFADVAYGYVSFSLKKKTKINFSIKILKTFSHSKKNQRCQFYHVCENANNPFDKPVNYFLFLKTFLSFKND